MKELSIEEKARRYDEVVNEIKNLRDMLLKEGVINKDGVICDNFNRIFPELKESEDERIRKGLLYVIEHHPTLPTEEAEEYIAWLERQEEPKYLDTSTCEPWSDEQTRRNLINFLKSLGATEIPQASYNRYLSYLEKQGEQNLADKVEPKSEWSEEDEKIRSSIIDFIRYELNHHAYIGTSGVNSALQIEWLNSLKDRVQPKQEWSEEDKRILNSIIQAAENHCFINLQERNWLKSLRPQSQWKPSEEQIKILEKKINGYLLDAIELDKLRDLLEQLKAL